MIRFALPIVALAFTGCMDRAPPETAGATPPGVECNSNGLESLIGKPRSAAVAEEAKRLSGANAVRWLTPGMMVTMEFRADRVNVWVGTSGKAERITCG